ncbi:hypothetical protein DRJ48_03690 [Candidatus Woesearchaeota archaeon]|nr:hypothetical protein [Candidatus Woesearchaeota archaeon]RLE42357.1 MAG: hypothetical protein DRJ48_03690 [Candidatus Woesearchaeota archaeon]
MKSYVIAVIGSEFVGKSEACHHIQKFLTKQHGISCYVIDEVVNSCPMPAQMGSTVESQQWILEKQRELISRLDGVFDVLVLDRTLLDNAFGYWQWAARKEKIPDSVIKAHLRIWGIRMTQELSDLIIFLHNFPATREMMQDGRRQGDPEWRDECYQAILAGVEEFREYTDTPKVFDVYSPLDRIPLNDKEARIAQRAVLNQVIEIVEKEVLPDLSQRIRKV